MNVHVQPAEPAEWDPHEVHVSRPEFVALVTKSTQAIALLNLALEMMKDIEDKMTDWEVE